MWIEIQIQFPAVMKARSRPARALWIEILLFGKDVLKILVEAREGLVD